MGPAGTRTVYSPATSKVCSRRLPSCIRGTVPTTSTWAVSSTPAAAIFRSALDECDDLARPLLEHPLLSVLYPGLYGGAPDPAALLEQMTYAQVALFALQYGLTKLWRSWGIEPAVVMGHSAGEYAAAAAAGLFSLADGLKLAAVRGQLLQAAGQARGHDDAKGMMAAVFADAKRVEPYLAPYARQVAVAAYNGPANVVISGHAAAVEQVLRELRAANIKARPLPIAQAAHSPLLDPLLPQFEVTVAGILAGLGTQAAKCGAGVVCDGRPGQRRPGHAGRLLARPSAPTGAVPAGNGDAARPRPANLRRDRPAPDAAGAGGALPARRRRRVGAVAAGKRPRIGSR